MRKYSWSIAIIGISIILLIFSFIQNNKEVYPEEVFGKEAKVFDKSFSEFLSIMDKNISSIKSNFSDTNKIKNVTETENFFLNFSSDNPFLISVLFVQNDNKISVRKSEGTFLVAIDSNTKVDVVTWKRFKKGKEVSSWKESFSNTINQSDWFKNLKNNKDQLSWYFDSKTESENISIAEDEMFYAAYPYSNKNTNCLILMRFSRMGLLKAFSTYSKYDHVNLLIQTADGKNMNLSSGITEKFENISASNDSMPRDSFRILTLHHFEKFDKVDNGIFNFNYDKNIIWNSFRKFDISKGINFYVLSIRNDDFVNSKSLPNSLSKLKWTAIAMFGIGLINAFFIFYKKPKLPKEEMASCIELLQEDESRTLEFKSSLRWDYRQEKTNPNLEKVIFKTIAALGNTDGGILLIGVDDDKNILGLDADFKTLKRPNSDFFEIHLRNLLHTIMGVKYVSSYIRMQFEVVENGKTVCKIKVLAAEEPLFIKTKDKNGIETEKFYVRSGNSSQEITSISDINDYLNKRFTK